MQNPEGNLPPEVTALVNGLAKRAGFGSRVRNDVRRELLAHFEDALDGVPPDEMSVHASALVSEFGNPEMLGTLIRRAKRRCRPAWFRSLLMTAQVALVVVLIAPAIALIQGWRAERELTRGLAELEKQGFPASWQQVHSCRPEGTVFFSGESEKSAASFLVRVETQPRAPFEDIEKLYDRLELNPPDIEQYVPKIRTALDSIRPIMDEARSVAALPPTSTKDIVAIARFEGPVGQDVTPGFGSIGLTRALIIDAWLQYREGRMDAAQQDMVTVLQLAGHVRDFPCVIDQLLAIATERFAYRALGWMGGLRDWPDTALSALASFSHTTQERRDAFAQAVTSESLKCRRILHGSVKDLIFTPTLTRSPKEWFMVNLYFTPPFRFLSAPDQMDYFTHFFETGQVLRKPYALTRVERTHTERFMKASKLHFLTSFISRCVAANDCALNLAECETWETLLRTAIALEQDKRAQGSFPETLDALKRDVCPDDFLDPFTGRSLVYKRSGSDFLLYSVGCDERDDGAKPTSDDIVWTR